MFVCARAQSFTMQIMSSADSSSHGLCHLTYSDAQTRINDWLNSLYWLSVSCQESHSLLLLLLLLWLKYLDGAA